MPAEPILATATSGLLAGGSCLLSLLLLCVLFALLQLPERSTSFHLTRVPRQSATYFLSAMTKNQIELCAAL